MKQSILSIFTVIAVLFLISGCENDEPTPAGFDYHVHINSPDLLDKNRGDTLQIDIDYMDHNGGIVHNIYYKLYNASDTSVVAKEFHDHAHETGSFNLTDMIWTDDVDSLSIFNCHCDWILQADVWDDQGGNRVSESIQFHVHPM